MLSTVEICEFLSRFSYKEGWEFTFYDGVWEGPHLRIYCDRVPDSFHPGNITTLDIHCFLSPNDIATQESLQTYLLYRLGRIEIHEMREFAKVDGRVISSPHMPNADRDVERFGVWRASVNKPTVLV